MSNRIGSFRVWGMVLLFVPLSALLVIGTTGCQDAARAAVDPQVLAEYRQGLLLQAEPSDPQHISAVVDSIDGSQEVSVIGKPGGTDTTFEAGMARFTLADCSQEGKATHDHADGDHSDCPYCKAAREASNRKAVVEFQAEDGQPVPVDARDLFTIDLDSTVVVRGTATVGPGGILHILANGLYVRD